MRRCDVFFNDTITRVRAPLIADKYGAPRRDWANAVRTVVDEVSVQPDTSAETTGDRSAVVTGWRVFTTRGADIDLLSTDRVEIDGLTLEVDGEVARYRIAGRVHHVEVRLRRVTG